MAPPISQGRNPRDTLICLPECVGFGNFGLGKGAEVVPTLPLSAVQMSFMQSSQDSSYMYGTTTWSARIDRNIMNIIT